MPVMAADLTADATGYEWRFGDSSLASRPTLEGILGLPQRTASRQARLRASSGCGLPEEQIVRWEVVRPSDALAQTGLARPLGHEGPVRERRR